MAVVNATPAAAASEPTKLEQRESHETSNHDACITRDASQTPGASHVHPGNDAARDEDATIKLEDDDDIPPVGGGDTATATTLRPAPQPSAKRRESEAGESATSEHGQNENKHGKKRKRAASPPWTFPSAETSFVKTADGRRVSARVNTGNTPVTSEAEDSNARARSNSQPTSRSRPPSPPWKRFEAQGPTSIQVDGVRKSGRVNKELTDESEAKPKRTSPRQKKQVNMLGSAPRNGIRPASQGTAGGAETVPRNSRHTRAASPSSKIRELQARIDALNGVDSPPSSPHAPQSAKGPHKRKRSQDELDHLRTPRHPSPTASRKPPHRPSTGDAHSDPTRPSPRIRLRFSGASSARHIIPAPHPNAMPPSPPRPPRLSLHQVIDSFELTEAQQPYTETERGPPGPDFFRQRNARQAAEEAATRRRILLEAKSPDGILSREKARFFQEEEKQAEPVQQYGHGDHVAAQALFFRALQGKEKAQHRVLAKKVALEAVEYWRLMRGPTEEDVRAEEERVWRLVYRQVVVDVRGKWEMVGAWVASKRREEWARENARMADERLKRRLAWSEAMLARQRGEKTGLGSEEEERWSADFDESGEENMSEDSEDAGEDEGSEEEGGGEMGEDELAAYLAQKEAEVQDSAVADTPAANDESLVSEMLQRPSSAASGSARVEDDDADDEGQDDEFENDDPDEEVDTNHGNVLDIDPSKAPSARRAKSVSLTREEQEADDNLSSDTDVEMDSENDYDSDEDMSSTGRSASGSEAGSEAEGSVKADLDSEAEPDDTRTSLLGFFEKKERNQLGLPTPTTSAEGDEHERTEDDSAEQGIATGQTDTGAAQDLPKETGLEPVDSSKNEPSLAVGISTPEPVDSVAPVSAPPSPEATPDAALKDLVPQPQLLRGTLRSYQHAGLDWLASLYRNGTNGILADEMGLGKTIQTISLLAHLAEEHEIWETHLIIVPTSVILNWVTEFQKFLPGFRVLGYYGTSDERIAKRKNWTNDPHHEQRDKRGYNVVITSYNIAMQDINAMRNVQWHFLVLDEAHNIRNFQSQRWQVLIRLKSRARLMLTGTPLQNSLTELWALLTFLTAGDDESKHGDLEEFLSNYRDIVQEIFEKGVSTLSDESRRVVENLHISLRPFLLRRLKSEVEKDLPTKTEKVVVCKLSKRQRQLYEEYMGLASTRQALTRGSGISAGRVLMALRRVCNHPDLFDPRAIQTSLAFEKWVGEGFVRAEGVVRRLLGEKGSLPGELLVFANEGKRKYAVKRSRQLSASVKLDAQVVDLRAQLLEAESQGTRDADMSTAAGSLVLQRLRQRERKIQRLQETIRITDPARQGSPIYGSDLRELVTIQHTRPYLFTQRGRTIQKFLRGWPNLSQQPLALEHPSDWLVSKSTALQRDVLSLDRLAQNLHDTIVRFAFCPPVATAPVLEFALPARTQELFRASSAYPSGTADFAHEARLRTAINFPDKRLLIYDAGKLQRLTLLLRDLQSRNSRSLIFTQSTATLDILEQFLSLLNLPYLRLDGSTHVERRQLYSAEFNRPDSRYQCMILSSRAGGVGLNLTGASSVIFYDLDWNPQMDRQCMDRAHRIGQVRDVEVYKMVSEKTIEENILRRANQKSLLDQTVIQEGHFTTEHPLPSARRESEGEEDEDEIAAALERFLGGGEKQVTQALDSVEDREDVAAAHQARKEDRVDDVDFAAERSSKGVSVAATPAPTGAAEADGTQGKEGDGMEGHVDGYMVRWMEEMTKDVAFVPPAPPKRLDKHGRDRGHRAKRKR